MRDVAVQYAPIRIRRGWNDAQRGPLRHFASKGLTVEPGLYQKSNIAVRRATVGPQQAAISGQLRSPRVTPAEFVSRCTRARGLLPSWSCEFDSRHPLHVKALVKSPFAMPPCFCVTARRGRAITRAIGFRPLGSGPTNWPLSPSWLVGLEDQPHLGLP
jgi:hypothetical protein